MNYPDLQRDILEEFTGRTVLIETPRRLFLPLAPTVRRRDFKKDALRAREWFDRAIRIRQNTEGAGTRLCLTPEEYQERRRIQVRDAQRRWRARRDGKSCNS